MRLCSRSLALRTQPGWQSSMLSLAVPTGCNDLSGKDCGYQAQVEFRGHSTKVAPPASMMSVAYPELPMRWVDDLEAGPNPTPGRRKLGAQEGGSS